MKDIESNNLGSKTSSELIVVLKKKDGAFRNRPCDECNYEFMDNKMQITIEQCYKRTVCIRSDSPIAIAILWDEFATIEKLLMLMDGEFYGIKSVKFLSSDITNGDEFDVYADECIDRRLSYYKTDPAYCYLSSGFIKSEEIIDGAIRNTWTAYPTLAIREVIANALIHQDFSISGTGPTVEIFSNRIEITTAGTPLVDINRIIDNPPRSRNEKLAEFMRRLKICEELGTGWDKIVLSCEIQQLPAPKIEVLENSTRVTLYSERLFKDISHMDRLWAC